MTLESSEREFREQYAAFAATGTLYAQVEGSPLLEFSAGGRVLYLFDRCGPYGAPPGPARVVVHGIVEELTQLPEDEERVETLTVQGVSGIEGRGRVLEVGRSTWVVHARVPLVLASFARGPALHPGEWVAFRTAPPLHGFVLGKDDGAPYR
ncbi:hypothetical protein HNQ07_002331 [Deinococcus metalli]|uniref:Uncharacterized protein n=1 Tax=Deinococcus metalli TaxID=1141878 RepID=A0A7W8NS79_9DEIO|nr:hypothetical protein [Deinococcus metalli]MBB5376867.1 hypothetical protein [Deinococcus metalli]GHF45949.1 hypothetical protein GCM10017781_22960 [Deinococcus metalli]